MMAMDADASVDMDMITQKRLDYFDIFDRAAEGLDEDIDWMDVTLSHSDCISNHRVPKSDLIQHEALDCVCIPLIRKTSLVNGRPEWHVIHSSLMGE